MWDKQQIAQKILEYIPQGHSVNLGIGLPSLVANYMQGKDYWVHSENGVLGAGPYPQKATDASATLINAAKQTITTQKGASFFDSALSFGMIRGGHIDFCVLGAMQVDASGSLANWKIPGGKLTGMGGAMDLVQGAKNVFIFMKHFNKKQESKLVSKLTLPATGLNVVNLVFSELGVFRPSGKKFEVEQWADGIDDVMKKKALA